MQATVIIPSLNPDEKLERVVEGLIAAGFERVVLVNDGSDSAHTAPFERLSALPAVTVLHHPQNKGKGCALKTAFAYVLAEQPDCPGVITVDGDGQHTAEDVRRLAQSMEESEDVVWLGARDFSAPQVPFRSRFGNVASRLTLRYLCGMRLQDTQTGLRAIPRCYLPQFMSVAGERFEYETNMLLEIQRQGIPYAEQVINTIYIEENKTSHFRPVQDSLRVYSLLLRHFIRFGCCGLLCFLVDILLFTGLLHVAFASLSDNQAIWWATVVARVLSSLLNFALNRRVVFASRCSLGGTLWRYYALCAVQMSLSAGLVMLLNGCLPLPESLAKCLVDGLLFFVSFRIQQSWVFGKKKR